MVKAKLDESCISRGETAGCVAAAEADLYVRLGPTSEWDTAAGQCVLEEAGGAVLDLKGEPLRYNTRDSLINPDFVAIGDPSADWSALFSGP